MQRLNLVDLIAANRKALAEKRLGAQQSRDFLECQEAQCLYEYDTTDFPELRGKHIGCAIGVGLNEGALGELEGYSGNQEDLDDLLEHRVVEVDGGEKGLLKTLQGAHDRWATEGKILHEGCPAEYWTAAYDWSAKYDDQTIGEPQFVELLDALERDAAALRGE